MESPPRLRLIGLVAGLGVLALGAGYMMLGRSQPSSSAAEHKVVPLSQRPHRKAKNTAHPAKRPARKPKPVTRPRPRPRPKPAATPPTENGLPGTLAASLARNRVVVVALYAPKVELDDMALAEAQAGAGAAGTGFLAINILDESQTGPLTKELGVLEDPAVLVFRRPGKLVTRFSGFVDKQTVFQAARNAGL
jgi:hypothetical protein